MVDLEIEGLSEAAEIGAGGSGRVYRARQLDLNRDVAVKMIHANYDYESQRLFQRERQLMASISNHPGIAPIYSSGTTSGGQYYFIMPYYAAGSVADRLAQGPIGWREAAHATAEVADAVDHAHRSHVLHCDLKPDNIMIDDNGHPVIVDFGIAKLVEGTVGLSRGIQMTPFYAPPEAFDGLPHESRSDIYSLGATLFAMISGTPPFATERGVLAIGMKAATEPVPDLRHLAPDEVCRCIERAMAKRPDDRYPTAAMLATDLREAIAAGASWSPPAPTPPEPATSVVDRSQIGMAGVGVPSGPPPGGPPVGGPPPGPYVSGPGPTGGPGTPLPDPVPAGGPAPIAGQAGWQPQPVAAGFTPTPSPPPGSAGPPPGGGHTTGGQLGPVPPTAARPGRRLWWLVAAVPIAAIVVVGAWFGLRALEDDPPGGDDGEAATADGPAEPDTDGATEAGEPTSETTGTTGTTATSETTTTTEAPRLGEIPSIDLAQGDCFNAPLTTSIFDTVTLVPCEEPHLAQVTGVIQHPDAGGTYPGQDALFDHGFSRCEDVFANYVGVGHQETELLSEVVTPVFEEWTNEQSYNLQCVAVRADQGTIDIPLEGAAADPQVSLDSGDPNLLWRLADRACFLPTDPEAEFAVDSVVGYEQTVLTAECSEPHRGQVLFWETLTGGTDGAYDVDALVDEGYALCEQAFIEDFGADQPLDGVNGIIPEFGDWDAGDRVVICIYLWAEPTTDFYP